jgi:hypothetical protein
MIPSKAAGEASVRPRVIEVVMRIVGARIVSNPSIVPGVDVRNVGMAIPIRFDVVLGRSVVLAASRRRGGSRGRGTVRGDVSTANCRGPATAAVRLPAALRKSRRANQNR